MRALSKEVEKRSGMPVSKTKPVVGDNIFGWETGIPVGYWKNAKDIDPLIMMPYMWTMVNQREPYIYTGTGHGDGQGHRQTHDESGQRDGNP